MKSKLKGRRKLAVAYTDGQYAEALHEGKTSWIRLKLADWRLNRLAKQRLRLIEKIRKNG